MTKNKKKIVSEEDKELAELKKEAKKAQGTDRAKNYVVRVKLPVGRIAKYTAF